MEVSSCNATGTTSGASTVYLSGSRRVHPRYLVGFVLLICQLSVFCFVDHNLSFCPFSSVLHQLTASDYLFGTFKLLKMVI
jgi:hypothetical protein